MFLEESVGKLRT